MDKENADGTKRPGPNTTGESGSSRGAPGFLRDREHAGPENGHRMLFERPEAQQLLCRIVAQLSNDATWRDDLLQEGMIHLWRLEERQPQQTLSWYLQSCRFHLRDYLALGRSVDSWKRRHLLVSVPAQGQDDDEPAQHAVADTVIISEISAEEMIGMLNRRLTPGQRLVMAGLAEGFSCREIARKLKVSHNAVAKHRRKIAAVACELGIAPDRR